MIAIFSEVLLLLKTICISIAERIIYILKIIIKIFSIVITTFIQSILKKNSFKTEPDTGLSPFTRKQRFDNGWFKECSTWIYNKDRSLCICPVVSDSSDPLFIEGNRVLSFNLVHKQFDGGQISILKLAQQGLYYCDNYVKCYACKKGAHLDEVTRGNFPVHASNCTAEHEVAERLNNQLWKKPE